MNIAIVTDDLIQPGGQERLVAAVSEIWPQAPIYTTQINERWLKYFEERKVKIVTSFMQNLPAGEKLNRYYFPSLAHILAFERFDFSDFDVVLSISSRFAHFVVTKPATLHISYINSPGRMFWEPHDYFGKETFGVLRPVKNLSQPLLSPFLSFVRQADYVAAQNPDVLIANSHYVQKKIKKYYKRDSEVIYPFIDASKTADYYKNAQPQNYFAVVTRLAAWKRVDIAVKACSELALQLKVIGGGPALVDLKVIAGPTVEFLGPASDDLKWKVLQNAKALIQTQQEDFGIVPLEAMLCGKPVIAFGAGGNLETIAAGKTGDFFVDQTSDSLKTVLRAFDASKYRALDCTEQAKKFDISIFKDRLKTLVQDKFATHIV